MPKFDFSELSREDLQEYGRRGGEALVKKYGTEHMKEIGKTGGQATKKKFEAIRAAGQATAKK